MTPQQFSAKWADNELKESAASKEHFLDVCALVGAPTPREADKTGEWYAFEKGVEKGALAGGGSKKRKKQGFADVFLRGCFAWEYKGPHKDLTAAYAQLQLYRDDLENPPLLVVSDMDRFAVHTSFTGTVRQVYSFTNAEIPREENLRVLRALFTDPDSLKPGTTTRSITEEAAGKFAVIADGLRSRGHDPHRAAHFLNRLLFCLFAEDVGLLPRDLFTRVVERTGRDPELFARYVGELFGAMASGGDFLLENIRHFNGGLFDDAEALPLEVGELRILIEAARLDWQSVEPAIFGTLFERSLDPAQRAKLGAHYTSRADILAVIEPVLMAPLRREWDGVRARAEAEAEKATAESGRKAVNALRRAGELLYGFAERLRGVRVLDPACGSGNFLYVALKEMLDLEKEVSAFAGTVGLTPFFPGVSPEQLHGIEMSPYAHELAQVVVWIGYLQWTRDNGFGTRQEPILGPMTNIQEMDAVLARDEDGSLVEPEWPGADVIVGNPPFLGDKKMRSELGEGYVDELRGLYKGRVAGGADLVAYWFEKARAQIEGGRAKRAGLLTTNGIRYGANRRVLQRVKATGDVFMAWRDRPWVQDGAAVRVSMVGFDDGSETTRTLDGEPVEQINADLTALVDVTGAVPLPENEGLCFLGVMKSGPFDINEEQAQAMLGAPKNPHGRPNSDVVKPRVGGQDVTGRGDGSFIVDFVQMGESQAALYERPFEHVLEHVKPVRDSNNDARQRKYWWLHGRPRPKLRKVLRGLGRCIVTPEEAKHRIFRWMDTDRVPDHTLHVVARDDDYFFGVLHSRAHELWSLSVGNYMGFGNDPRYNSSRTFKTFPFPWPPGTEPAEGDDPRVATIAEAARALDHLRNGWLRPEGVDEADLEGRTLTTLYNARPTWLANAHADLDRAVFAAYGWEEDPEEMSEQELLERLLGLNARRAEEAQAG